MAGAPDSAKGDNVNDVAVVTGAARGIGAAVTRTLTARLGMHVLALDLDERVHAAHEGSDMVTAAVADAADEDELGAAVERVAGTLGPPTVGVANAGIQRDGRLGQLGTDDWQEVLRVDLTAAFLLARLLWSAMVDAGGGRLVALSSIAKDGNFGQANYAAAKSGLVGLARTAAIEGGPHGITANVVCPGVIDTPGTRAFAERAPDAFGRFVARVPARRPGTAQEVADAVAFLCGPTAGYVSGQVLYVDGGLSSGHT